MPSKPSNNPTFWRRAFIASIVWVVLPILLGLSGTVIGMIRAFQTIEETGVSDPKELADAISISLGSTAIGLVIAFPGLVLFIVCLIRSATARKREPEPEPEPQVQT